jgi:glycosyltransferase involved in cell wall biosynthesis
LAGFARFLFLLLLARWRKARLIWTVHNLYPHDPCNIPKLDRVVRWILVKSASLFLIHGPSAEQMVLETFPAVKGRALLIPHGNWIGYYPDRITCQEARARLGWNDETGFVFLFLGLCKPYKGLEELIQSVQSLPGNPRLVIAGAFQSPQYEQRIRDAVAGSRSPILLVPGFVRTEDVQIYLRSCNAVVAPYLKTLTSGSAMMAMSFGRPVIAPAVGHLRDVVAAGCGVLYEQSDPNGLAVAMSAAMQASFAESGIKQSAARHTWQDAARIFYDWLTRAHADALRR